MPQLMTLFGYKVYFWSNENNPLEPIHVHISKHPHKNTINDFSDEIIQKIGRASCRERV